MIVSDFPRASSARWAVDPLLSVMLLCLAGCRASVDPQADSQPESKSEAWFRETAAADGIDFLHISGHQKRQFLMPEIMCGGVAVFDMDNDGDLDIYLVQSGSLADAILPRPGNQLYRNEGHGRFINVTESNGAGDTDYGMGVTTGDYDNDGDVDIYVTNAGANVLLQNDGQGVFEDVTQAAGVGDEGFGSSCAFLDYDRDGDLDLITINYIVWSRSAEIACVGTTGPDYCSPNTYRAPAPDRLYRNNGDGTFDDVTQQAGLTASYGNGLGVVCSDFNGDGWIDIFVANDGVEDQMWINQQDETFRDHADTLCVAVDLNGKAKAGMGVDAVDVDDDGDIDLLVVNLRNETDSFLLNHGEYFVDQTGSWGLGHTTRPMTRFGVALVDFNNDGHLDLYEAAGKVMRFGTSLTDDPYAEPNLLLAGTPSLRLEPVSAMGGAHEAPIATSRGAAFGDLDNDGRIDIVVANRDAAPYVLRNVVAKSGHWIAFRVLNRHGSDAFGAGVQITVGQRRMYREVRTAYSYCAANDPRVHFGLGEIAVVDQVTVTWPDGTTTRSWGPVDLVDRYYRVQAEE